MLFTPLVFLRENMHKTQLIYTVPKGLFCKGHEWEEMHPLPSTALGRMLKTVELFCLIHLFGV